MDHGEVDGNNYIDKKDERLDYVRQDVLCTAFSYAGYCKDMEKTKRFSTEGSLSAPGLGWNYFNSLKTQKGERFCTYFDKYMRWFVRQSIKGASVCVSTRFHKSKKVAMFQNYMEIIECKKRCVWGCWSVHEF